MLAHGSDSGWQQLHGSYSYLGEANYLPSEVTSWLGVIWAAPFVMNGKGQVAVHHLNDTEVPFTEIAKKIRREWLDEGEQ